MAEKFNVSTAIDELLAKWLSEIQGVSIQLQALTLGSRIGHALESAYQAGLNAKSDDATGPFGRLKWHYIDTEDDIPVGMCAQYKDVTVNLGREDGRYYYILTRMGGVHQPPILKSQTFVNVFACMAAAEARVRTWNTEEGNI